MIPTFKQSAPDLRGADQGLMKKLNEIHEVVTEATGAVCPCCGGYISGLDGDPRGTRIICKICYTECEI